MKEESYYEVLGVRPDADRETLRKAFLEKALTLHPDKRRGTGGQDLGQSFFRVNLAYETLQDASRREAYDKLRHAAGAAGSDRYKTLIVQKAKAQSPPGDMEIATTVMRTQGITNLLDTLLSLPSAERQREHLLCFGREAIEALDNRIERAFLSKRLTVEGAVVDANRDLVDYAYHPLMAFGISEEMSTTRGLKQKEKIPHGVHKTKSGWTAYAYERHRISKQRTFRFNIWKSWRLSFLLAKLQSEVWSSRGKRPSGECRSADLFALQELYNVDITKDPTEHAARDSSDEEEGKRATGARHSSLPDVGRMKLPAGLHIHRTSQGTHTYYLFYVAQHVKGLVLSWIGRNWAQCCIAHMLAVQTRVAIHRRLDRGSDLETAFLDGMQETICMNRNWPLPLKVHYETKVQGKNIRTRKFADASWALEARRLHRGTQYQNLSHAAYSRLIEVKVTKKADTTPKLRAERLNILFDVIAEVLTKARSTITRWRLHGKVQPAWHERRWRRMRKLPPYHMKQPALMGSGMQPGLVDRPGSVKELADMSAIGNAESSDAESIQFIREVPAVAIETASSAGKSSRPSLKRDSFGTMGGEIVTIRAPAAFQELYRLFKNGSLSREGASSVAATSTERPVWFESMAQQLEINADERGPFWNAILDTPHVQEVATSIRGLLLGSSQGVGTPDAEPLTTDWSEQGRRVRQKRG